MNCALLKDLPISGSDFTLVRECMNSMSFGWNWKVRLPPENHIQKKVQLIIGILMEPLRWGKSCSKETIPCPHTESDLDGVNFLHKRSYGAFWICDLTAVDHTSIFAEWLLGTRLMLTVFTLSFQKVIWRWARGWEGSQPGQLTWTGQNDVLY